MLLCIESFSQHRWQRATKPARLSEYLQALQLHRGQMRSQFGGSVQALELYRRACQQRMHLPTGLPVRAQPELRML